MRQSATIGGLGQALIASIVGAVCATAVFIGLSPRRPGPVEPLSALGVIVAFTVCVLLIGAVTEVLKAIRVSQPVQTILGTALGAVAWIILLDARHPDARFLGAINDQWVVCAAVLLATPLLALVVTAAHEAGHALAGRAVGLRVDAIAFGPVIARRTGGRLRLRRYGRVTGSGGFVRCTHDGATPCWWRRAIVAAGGPAADVLVVVGALVVDAWFRARGLRPMPVDVAVVVGTAVVGASAADNAVRFVLGSPDRNLIGRALKHRRPATAQGASFPDRSARRAGCGPRQLGRALAASSGARVSRSEQCPGLQ